MNFLSLQIIASAIRSRQGSASYKNRSGVAAPRSARWKGPLPSVAYLRIRTHEIELRVPSITVCGREQSHTLDLAYLQGARIWYNRSAKRGRALICWLIVVTPGFFFREGMDVALSGSHGTLEVSCG